MKPEPPEFIGGGVYRARRPDGNYTQIELDPGEWRPRNWMPNGYAIDRFEVADERDESGNFPIIVVLSGPKF